MTSSTRTPSVVVRPVQLSYGNLAEKDELKYLIVANDMKVLPLMSCCAVFDVLVIKGKL